jgi:LysR family transcriptional regulator, glycine cleavage system transcriptional activator
MWLPSLRGLRAVEAALRLGSFAAAAKELGVTQTAISRLVKEVERQLARPLFERKANQSHPTAFAVSLQSGLGDGFRRLEATVAEARRAIDDPTVTLSVGPTFAMRWLIPHLTEFHATHPEIDLRLATTINREVTPGPDTLAAIRLAAAQVPGFVTDALFSGRLMAVCRPDIIPRTTGRAGWRLRGCPTARGSRWFRSTIRPSRFRPRWMGSGSR